MNIEQAMTLIPLGANIRYKHRKMIPDNWSVGKIVSVNIHNQYVIETRDEHFIAESKDWIIEIITDEDRTHAVDFFYNETGDYTLTLFDEPIGIIKDEVQAEQLKRYFLALSSRIDFLQKELKLIQYER